MIGRTISHYRILDKLGEGGMGVVYRAVDTRLERAVAIKFLPPEAVADPERKGRFVREAKAASALNHPNIVTIYDIGSADGLDFIAMEQVEGEPLDRRIGTRGLPIEEALRYATEVAEALAAAHAAGIVHRDVKPANVMVTTSGRVKVLDFGLAKLVEPRAEGVPLDSRLATATGVPPATAATKYTREGTVLGTLAYMSPEQVEGKPADARADVFALGAVLYEMLAGRRPFRGDSTIGMMTAILRDAPPPLKSVRADVPTDVERIVRRCLEKNPDLRYPSARELAQELSAARAARERPSAALTTVLRQPRYAIPAVLLLLAVAGGVAWIWMQGAKERWARNEALPQIAGQVEKGKNIAAYRLALEAERHLPGDRELARLLGTLTIPASVVTDPPGAELFFKDYNEPRADWHPLGRSPFAGRLPWGYLRWKATKEGYEDVEGVPSLEPGADKVTYRFILQPGGSVPPGMVRVRAGTAGSLGLPAVDLPGFWLDRHEVTNRQFKEFVDRGGYEKDDWWTQPFVRGGRPLSREDATASFRDSTGRPGPATWELGSYPDGQADYPVRGVSWYEAAAYAEFAGKSLPTIHQWLRAADPGPFSEVLPASNFDGKGPARVGEYSGLGPFGTYDMAGNVAEWCWNSSGSGRYLVGGSWSDPSYLFLNEGTRDPFERSANVGFRCAKNDSHLPANVTGPFEPTFRDYLKEKPASEAEFRIYRSFYSYDRTDLAPSAVSADESSPHWRREKVSVAAAYGGERLPIELFLPRGARPPYQAVVYFPESPAERLRSLDDFTTRYYDFIVRSGRAFIYPIYKGTYERRLDPSAERHPAARRDQVIQWTKDLGRTIDYLETRRDIDRERLAFYGFSLGAVYGPIFTAIENRFRASILLGGGFPNRRLPPEADAINFAPRVTVPTLMIGGRQDFVRPIEISQRPLFRALGCAPGDKRLALIEGGHLPPELQPVIKEMLDWLDRYLGPVMTRR